MGGGARGNRVKTLEMHTDEMRLDYLTIAITKEDFAALRLLLCVYGAKDAAGHIMLPACVVVEHIMNILFLLVAHPCYISGALTLASKLNAIPADAQWSRVGADDLDKLVWLIKCAPRTGTVLDHVVNNPDAAQKYLARPPFIHNPLFGCTLAGRIRAFYDRRKCPAAAAWLDVVKLQCIGHEVDSGFSEEARDIVRQVADEPLRWDQIVRMFGKGHWYIAARAHSNRDAPWNPVNEQFWIYTIPEARARKMASEPISVYDILHSGLSDAVEHVRTPFRVDLLEMFFE